MSEVDNDGWDGFGADGACVEVAGVGVEVGVGNCRWQIDGLATGVDNEQRGGVEREDADCGGVGIAIAIG